MTIAKTTTTPADLVVSAFPTSEEIAHALRTGNRIHVDDSTGDNIGRSISALEATSIDEVFGSELTKPSSILGTTLKLERFEGLRSSDFEDSALGAWAIFQASTPDGEMLTIGTGAQDPVVKLVKLHELGAFDSTPATFVVFEESKKATANGYYPLNLNRVKVAEDSAGNVF